MNAAAAESVGDVVATLIVAFAVMLIGRAILHDDTAAAWGFMVALAVRPPRFPGE